ncbi:MAG: hypothetical protein IKL05_04450 [Clostridia bacterium]|nr:hypothetical protein [Clostridia bacterium]
MARSFNIRIDKFLGLHQCEAGESRLRSGESPRMKNLTVTPSYTLLQRDGWERVAETSGEGRAIFTGAIKGKDRVIWVVSDKVYSLDNGEISVIGELESSEGKVSIFHFASKLYFLDGTKIKVWDGDSFGDIEPYVPLIAISCDYSGAGTSFEDVNLLTGKKRQSFTTDGENKWYQLAETELDSVDLVVLDGKVMSSSKYSVNLTKGLVEFNSVPSSAGVNNLEITFTKGSAEGAGNIHRMTHALSYGGDNDTRVFLWGDAEYPSIIRYSGVYGGISGMEYFPELNFNRIGDGGEITSALRHYDKLVLFTESEAFQCWGETKTDINGMEYTVFPIKTVSSQVGCASKDFAKLIDNKPITLTHSGLYLWSSSSIRDERNAQEIGERIRVGLKSFDTERVSSFDRSATSELYIWQGERVYVYNYALDLFYYYEGFDATAFSEDREGLMWFVRADGALCRITDEKLDGGSAIEFCWDSGYEEICGLDTKNVHRLEFELYPISTTSFSFVWVSEYMTSKDETLEIKYKVFDFSNIWFDSFIFNTAVTPVRLHKRIKTKRTKGFKIMLKNDGDRGDFHLLSLSVIGRVSDTQ